MIQFATCKNKIASDINPYSIAFLQKIQKEGCEWLPKNNKEFTEEDYNYMKQHKEWFDKALLGFIGFSVSFGGKWFNGWSRGKDNKGNNRDYVTEAYNNAVNQMGTLKGIDFKCCSYDELDIPENSVIYADPPYKSVTKYDAVSPFDYEKFYEWCRKMSTKGHKVYVSEYNMPDDFKCIWQKDLKVTVSRQSDNQVAVERLYTL